MRDRLEGTNLTTLIGMRLSDIARPENSSKFSQALVKVGLLRYNLDPRDQQGLKKLLIELINQKVDNFRN